MSVFSAEKIQPSLRGQFEFEVSDGERFELTTTPLLIGPNPKEAPGINKIPFRFDTLSMAGIESDFRNTVLAMLVIDEAGNPYILNAGKHCRVFLMATFNDVDTPSLTEVAYQYETYIPEHNIVVLMDKKIEKPMFLSFTNADRNELRVDIPSPDQKASDIERDFKIASRSLS